MTESQFSQLVAPAVPLQAVTNTADDSNNRRSASMERKRKLSNSESVVDLEFLNFLTGAGLLDSFDAPEEHHSFMSGLLPFDSFDARSHDFAQHAAELAAGPSAMPMAAPAPAAAAPASALAALPAMSATQWDVQQAATCDLTRAHAAANNVQHKGQCVAATVPASAHDDDTRSTETVPMPHKRRRRQQQQQQLAGDDDGDDACSSANDLVEVPCSSADEPHSFRPHTPPRSPTPTAAAPAAAAHSPERAIATASPAPTPPTPAVPPQPANSSIGASAAAGATAASPVAAASSSTGDGVVTAVLVAKVLTRSDATSKRIILPRIAVEANLPQLATADIFNFTAKDAVGRTWELVIKAWANGSNPRPVFVMEQVQELMKSHGLGAGDAFGLAADAQGNFYVELNTDAVRSAAAQPTLSSFAFAQQGLQQQQGAVAAGSRGGKGGKGRKRAAPAATEGGAAAQAQVTVGGEFTSAQHDNGRLLCPRTPGCTRPPGHQGWCVGHRGFKTMHRRR